ncbi:hypothetical protein BN1708_017150, partial [Verticillium longisporum]
MDHISRLPLTEENLQQHIVLAIMVSSLLQSDINLIGLSVMDVLIGFIRHMERLMHLPGPSGLPRTDSLPSATCFSTTSTRREKQVDDAGKTERAPSWKEKLWGVGARRGAKPLQPTDLPTHD